MCSAPSLIKRGCGELALSCTLPADLGDTTRRFHTYWLWSGNESEMLWWSGTTREKRKIVKKPAARFYFILFCTSLVKTAITTNCLVPPYIKRSRFSVIMRFCSGYTWAIAKFHMRFPSSFTPRLACQSAGAIEPPVFVSNLLSSEPLQFELSGLWALDEVWKPQGAASQAASGRIINHCLIDA